MQKVLVVVDMQNDFIDGALGTKEAVAIVPGVKEKIENFDGVVLFTRDTHETYYLDTQEGKKLPVPHCIRDTEGWQIRSELDALRKTEPIDKEEYMELNTEPEEPDSAENENTLETPEHDIHAGDIVQHFKREWVSPDTSEYLYKVLAVAHHTENGEKLMIYQALYAPFKICARPYDMFMSEVDRDKYPDIKQKYRFEKYSAK